MSGRCLVVKGVIDISQFSCSLVLFAIPLCVVGVALITQPEFLGFSSAQQRNLWGIVFASGQAGLCLLDMSVALQQFEYPSTLKLVGPSTLKLVGPRVGFSVNEALKHCPLLCSASLCKHQVQSLQHWSVISCSVEMFLRTCFLCRRCFQRVPRWPSGSSAKQRQPMSLCSTSPSAPPSAQCAAALAPSCGVSTTPSGGPPTTLSGFCY